ncbi:hypothetical protein MIZ01_2247 [Sideroxyarcus emersonii]|uniref:Uncharacterized protein n=2 Tax=Sideroxyarcus emersonii TaxID=2764705 RepID=A0AAN1XC96_9PROT|nr:hypothetical protein MIZ01_2247 [Sideroxyarcus emersonii]
MGMMADFASAYLDSAYKKKKAGEKFELPTDGHFLTVFYGFTEIQSTLDALALTETLIGLAPPRSKHIDKDCYLKFLVGAYLQEVYILEQRLTTYAKKLSRLYRKPALPPAVRKVVYEPLQGIISTRGSHVHNRRYSDETLDMVSTTALFRRLKHQLGEDLEFDYKVAQSNWKKQINANNKTTRKIIDMYCELLQVVICKNDKIVLPVPKKQ